MTSASHSWLMWAVLSAVFAALTAIFAKVGVTRMDADLATLVRTLIISALLAVIFGAMGKIKGFGEIGAREWLFLALSALATGASWLCYFRALKVGDAARVAPVDKLSVVIVAVLGVTLLGEHLSLRAAGGVILIGLGAVLVALG